MSICTMSSFLSSFEKIDAMFLEFGKDLNTAGGSFSMDDNWLERYVHANGRIPMSISFEVEKPISLHVVRFSQTIGVCVRRTFLVSSLRWVDVGREYIKRFFVLGFNDQAINRFVEHQILTYFKEFMEEYHRHFKKYRDPKAHANPPHILVERMKDWHFLYDHYMSHAFQAADDAHNQMMELQSQPTSEGSQSLSGNEICEIILDR
ncbi:CACTA en-spm transposon protein [Cucumis melo var. makuwa]|uniref:CACTA en-spm transposon protein n=1 Tax=Cucumis melo var. makuwa TaxID=1194695 RepID=A0A5A7T8P2_CUCMM|nr:CACTA en-spm transposon protein [Cucumis melo var. makuwa]TYK02205.1 CACTA en-spm transposon protein [Cucumis melo var. makuwa]